MVSAEVGNYFDVSQWALVLGAFVLGYAVKLVFCRFCKCRKSCSQCPNS